MTQTIRQLTLSFLIASAITLAWATVAHASGPGDLDITFHGTGIVTTPVSSGSSGAYDIAIQPDGKLVVAGHSDFSSFLIARYNSDGSLDTTFNNTGIVTTSLDGFALGMTIQPDGKIVAVGSSNNTIALVRYTITGSLDSIFNGTGIVTTTIPNKTSYGRSLVIQPDSKIAVAGVLQNQSFSDTEILLVRYNSDGSLDPTLNGTGIVTTPIGIDAKGWSIALQSDNRIVIGGPSYGPPGSFTVVRYTTSGSLDVTFNGTGIVTTTIGANSGVHSTAIQPDGKIVVSGLSGGTSPGKLTFAIARYNSDGSLDSNFNSAGVVTTTLGPFPSGLGTCECFTSVALQQNGKIVVAGITNSGTDPLFGYDLDFVVVRYNHDGSLDTTFKSSGVVTTSLGTIFDWGEAVAIQSNGKIVVAGSSGDNTAIVRYLGDPISAYLPTILKN